MSWGRFIYAVMKYLRLCRLARFVTGSYQTAVGDGCHLVFSNSVIEAVGDWNKIQQFVHECSRVDKEIYIQTSRSFPLPETGKKDRKRS